MTKRKTKRNTRPSQERSAFKISRNPVRHFARGEAVPHVLDRATRPVQGERRLFAIARDAQTIFATWKIDWRTIFKHAAPADRQVHLRLIDGDGAIETTVAVEVMSTMHYVTVTGLHQSYHVEIGYFQPLDAWRLVAKSETIEMPLRGNIALTDADLATIPFHLNFQQLANFFGATHGFPVAKKLAEVQKRAASNGKPNETARFDSQVLRDLKLSVREIAAAARDFKKVDTEKLARRARATLQVAATSSTRAFQASAGS